MFPFIIFDNIVFNSTLYDAFINVIVYTHINEYKCRCKID